MPKDFVHLHVHSDFSLLDGAASIKKLVAKAKNDNMHSLALTDHGNMFGALQFYRECKAENIK
ncbi:MAG: PHP domain-containing protein, partial [Planctomycetota bacterium]|nr:PHP domain-containing protein [Planctomycetota bacterium]